MKPSVMKGLIMALTALTALTWTITAVRVQKDSPTALAIQIGSHITRLGVLDDNGRPQLISVSPGIQSAPGPVYSSWTPEGFLLIPEGTDEDLFVHPFNTLFNLKHPFAFIFKDLSAVRPKVTGHQAWTLQDITAKYLKKLQTIGESITGGRIGLLAMVKPSYMNLDDTIEDRRHAIASAIADVHPDIAGNILGLKSILSSYGVQNDLAWIIEEERAVAVYHLGGSTLEATILLQDSGISEILSSVHDPDFGGKDFNRRLVHHLVLAHQKRTSRDLSGNYRFMMQLEREVEKAKQLLSSRKSVRIEIRPLSSSSSTSNPPFESDDVFYEQLTRSQFEELNKDLFLKTFEAMDKALLDAGMTKEAIQDVILSGGSARIPFIQSALKDYFGGNQCSKIYNGWDRPEITALFGAAKIGHWNLNRNDAGICCFGYDPLSVGIQTTGGVMYRFADEDSARSIRNSVDFSTVTDYQDRVMVKVFEGQRALTKDNTFMGKLEFSGIPPAPQGVPQIRVRMDSSTCDSQIRLTVVDLATKRIMAIEVSPPSARLQEDTIERKKEAAKPFEHVDKAIWEFAKMAGTMNLLDPV